MQTTTPANAKVLVVEDDVLIRMHGIDLLEEAGYQVSEACDADDALSVLEQSSDIQLVFSDIDMPGSMNGIALAFLVHKRWPEIRVLLTSGGFGPERRQAEMPGRFVAKPYTDETVVAEIGRLLAA